MKKGLLRCIAVVMVVLMTAVYVPMTDVSDLFSVEAAAATKTGSLGGNVSWSYDSNTRTITVSGTGNMKNFANGDDGQDWDSLVVGTAFPLQYPNKHAEKIVINNGITNIGNNAFRGLTAVKSVSIPASVKSIGTSAFEGCSALTTVNIPTGVTSIGANAFKGTKFASVDLPYTVTSIGNGAFANISGLKITCFYGDAGYKYCMNNNATAVVRQFTPVVEATLDATNKQVKVVCKVKNALFTNAANFTLTYNGAVAPVSTGDYTYNTDANGISTVVVYNETGKISIATIVAERISANACGSDFTYTVAEITFKINGQADKAEFSFTPDTVMINELVASANAATANADLHVYTEKIEEADCKNPGTKVVECSVCGKKTETSIPVDSSKHGDTEIKNKKDATCNEAGYTGDTVCKLCGVVVTKGSDVPATGTHDYDSVVTNATCTSSGFTTYTCKVCGHSYVGDETAALAHDYETVVTEATCTSSGFTTYTCKACVNSYKGDFTAELSHDFDANGECTRCDEVTVISITFTDNTGITIDDESKVIIFKNTLNAEKLKANIASGNWTVTDAKGTALADNAAIATGSLIKAETADVTYTVIILGDVNLDGRVNASDARSILRITARLDSATELSNLAANCDGKANVTAADARVVLRVAAKLQSF